MKKLTEVLKNHKGTIGYDVSINIDGYDIPDVGETIYTDNQSMLCTKVIVYDNGFVTVVFENGMFSSGWQIAHMVATGKVKIK